MPRSKTNPLTSQTNLCPTGRIKPQKLEVLKRYLDQNEEDLHRAHEHSSPVDNTGF